MKHQDCPVLLRRAVPEDEPKLIQIQCTAIAVLAARDYNRQQIKALVRSKSKPRFASEITFVAEINGCVVGFASMFGNYNIVSAVFVNPDFVRRGIASLLLKKLEQMAVEQQVPLIWVSSSLTGQNFYRANGYLEVDKINLILGSSYIPCIRMKKRLSPLTWQEVRYEVIQLVTASLLICFAATLIYAMAQLTVAGCQIYLLKLWNYIHGVG